MTKGARIVRLWKYYLLLTKQCEIRIMVPLLIFILPTTKRKRLHKWRKWKIWDVASKVLILVLWIKCFLLLHATPTLQTKVTTHKVKRIFISDFYIIFSLHLLYAFFNFSFWWFNHQFSKIDKINKKENTNFSMWRRPWLVLFSCKLSSLFVWGE